MTNQRNLPSIEGSSRLSPHLHFGEISPATVWHAVSDKRGSVETFLGELGWRDYAQNVILQLPDYGKTNGRSQLDSIEWRSSRADLRAWQQGLTGYPIVDAGMRQLWATGWMHNRVRMIAASFLVKHLLIDWREGEQWFWDTLVDADYGTNSVNWQWVAGTGIDANMFVPDHGAADPVGEIRRGRVYSRMGARTGAISTTPTIHDPPDDRRGSYPAKIVDHREARERALAAHRAIR